LRSYFAAMNCAANTAFANRQVITHQIRGAFAQVFDRSAEELGMELVYDVAHYITKVERYPEGELLVHRKGATRAFGPGSPDVPRDFQKIGQPVICGGSMETGSYVLVGTDRAVRETFGSTMHGAGPQIWNMGSGLVSCIATRSIYTVADQRGPHPAPWGIAPECAAFDLGPRTR
jgi:tRNA-splicing ligase RtcB